MNQISQTDCKSGLSSANLLIWDDKHKASGIKKQQQCLSCVLQNYYILQNKTYQEKSPINCNALLLHVVVLK